MVCEQDIFYYSQKYKCIVVSISSVLTSIASDTFGRKPLYILGTTIATICCSIIPTAPVFLAYIIGLLGKYTALTVAHCSVEVIFLEICSYTVRTPLIIFSYAFIPFAKIISQYLHNIIPSWRLSELGIQWPTILIVFGIIFLPESPLWLMVKNQYYSAWKVLWDLGSNEVRINEYNLPYSFSIQESIGVFIQKKFMRRMCFMFFMVAVANLTVVTDILNSLNKTTKENMHYVEVVLIIVVGTFSYYVSKQKVIAGILIFLATSYAISTSTSSDGIEYVALIATTTTSRTITPIIFVYTMEIIPTTHRATARGCAVAASVSSKYILLMYMPIMMTSEAHRILRSICLCLCITCALLINFGPVPPVYLPNDMRDLED